MALPFLNVVAFAIENCDERKFEEYYLREGAESAIAIPKLRLIKKLGVFEKQLNETDFYIDFGEHSSRLGEIDDIKMIKEADSLKFEFKDRNQTIIRKFSTK